MIKYVKYGEKIYQSIDSKVSPRPLIDKICQVWRENLSFKNQKYKCELKLNEKGFDFELLFLTWHNIYLTGKIVLSTEG